jgi:hypothetical protein
MFCSSLCCNSPKGRQVKGLSFGWVTLTCAVCAKSFSRKTSLAKKKYEKRQYCSLPCARTPRQQYESISPINQQALKEKRSGKWSIPEYRVWKGMLARCLRLKNSDYHRYGGRGITVCERWREENGFANFYHDMKARPSGGYWIERRNNDGNYEPDNCYWATIVEQQNNKSTTLRFKVSDGRDLTISQLSAEFGIRRDTLYSRLITYGMPIEQALTIEHGQKVSGNRAWKYVSHRGIKLAASQWDRKRSWPKGTVLNRLRAGWEHSRAVTQPIRRRPEA